MDDKRQKNQLVLAFMRRIGVKPEGLPEGTESSAGKRGMKAGHREQLMEEVCERKLQAGIEASQGNKGSPAWTV